MDNKTDQQLDLDHLNLDTNEMAWGGKQPPMNLPLPRDSREIGGKVVANSAPSPSQLPRAERVPKPSEVPLPTPDQSPDQSPDQLNTLQTQAFENLITPGPTLEAPTKQNTAAIEEALNTPFDKTAFKTTDKLDQTGVEAIDAAVEKLNQDGDIANFYDTARQMMEANLDNSYDRKLGEGIK